MFLRRPADTIPVQVQELRGKRVTVAGLGRFGGGTAVARWLVEQGATVLVTDRDRADKLADSVAKLDGLPIQLRLGEPTGLSSRATTWSPNSTRSRSRPSCRWMRPLPIARLNTTATL